MEEKSVKKKPTRTKRKARSFYQGQAFLLFIFPVLIIEGLNGYKNIQGALRNVLEFVFERYFIFVLTVVFFYFVYLLLSIIFFKKRQFAYIISLLLIMVVAIVHFFKQQFLGTVLQLNDFNLLKSQDQQTGLTGFIAGKLDVVFLLIYVVLFIAFAVWGWYVFRNMKSVRDNRLERGGLSVLFALFFISYSIFPNMRVLINGAGGVKIGENANINYHNAGVILGMFNNETTFNQTMNYDEAINLLTKDNKKIDPIVDMENEKVDVVSVMLEGNFPVEETYNDVQFSSSVQPFFKSLQEKSLYSGHTIADTFGNGTGISEFNYLTGMSNKMFPQPYIAYESQVGNYLPSVVANIAKYKPNLVVNHDFNKAFYNRENVYQNMGFQKFNGISEITKEMNFPDVEKDNYMADEPFLQYVDKQLEENQDKSNYQFNITMQNHFPYPKSQEGDEDVNVVKAPDSYTSAQKENLRKIATGMKSTDKALKNFIEKIQNRNKKTIVVLFGDHQPIINEKFVSEKKADKDYLTHYAVWANFPVNKKTVKEDLPIAELGTRVQQLIGVDKKEILALHGFYAYLKAHNLSYTQLAEYAANDFYHNDELKRMYTAFFTIHMYNYQGKNFNEGNQVTKEFLENERKKYFS